MPAKHRPSPHALRPSFSLWPLARVSVERRRALSLSSTRLVHPWPSCFACLKAEVAEEPFLDRTPGGGASLVPALSLEFSCASCQVLPELHASGRRAACGMGPLLISTAILFICRHSLHSWLQVPSRTGEHLRGGSSLAGAAQLHARAYQYIIVYYKILCYIMYSIS